MTGLIALGAGVAVVTGVGAGIGIGLALARSIFELQNGTITACNLQNGGACFEIRMYSH